jgi:hypothetical protein
MSKAASSHSLSYYDWELTFKRKSKAQSTKDEKVNTLGISNDKFKDFIKIWKEKNLS